MKLVSIEKLEEWCAGVGPEDVHDLLAYAKSQAVESGWISVKERLPEKNEMVLVYFPNFPVHMRYGYWDNDEHLTFASLTNEKEGIATHWMPLPTPPQPEGEANEK